MVLSAAEVNLTLVISSLSPLSGLLSSVRAYLFIRVFAWVVCWFLQPKPVEAKA